VFGVREEVRRDEAAALVYVWQAAAGTLRSEARRGNVYTSDAKGSPAKPLAIRGSASRRSAGVARRRHDSARPCQAPRGVPGPRESLCERRRAESYGLVQSAGHECCGHASEAARRQSFGGAHCGQCRRGAGGVRGSGWDSRGDRDAGGGGPILPRRT